MERRVRRLEQVFPPRRRALASTCLADLSDAELVDLEQLARKWSDAGGTLEASLGADELARFEAIWAKVKELPGAHP